jgi:5-methyltetrahydropteroyltriglutamate--homocysteine methyltransferase
MSLETTIAGGYPKIGDSVEEQKLRRALHQLDKDEISDEDFERIQNEVTKEVIREQTEAGMDLVTDGLIRWDDPLTYEARKIAGYEFKGLIRYFDTNTFYREMIAETRLEYRKPLVVSDYQFAAAHSSKPVRAVLTGPFTLALHSRNQFYRESKQLAFDLAHLIHREAEALEQAGCVHIQFDEPALLSRKSDLPLFFKIYEIVTAQLSKSEKTLFLNFGNLDGIYPKILNVGVERIGLELTKGHQNWEVLKQAPFTKKMTAGIVDARNTRMETEQEAVDAIHQLSEHVNAEELRISTSHSLEFLPRANARKKMEFLAQAVKVCKGASVS